jgi:hypothetical protein
MRRGLIFFLLAILSVSISSPARASFHVMQIEQVIAGANGDPAAQAIQLRMRALGENFVSLGRLRAWDAAGANPIVIMDPTGNVTQNTAGSRVLFETSAFASAYGPTPDFVITNPIPVSYLAAGSITWEDNAGTVYWRLSWGGAGYTGSGAGSTLNDADGNYSPPFPSALPSNANQALLFGGAAGAQSTNNATDYQLTTGNPVFTNNAGQSAVVTAVGDGGTIGPGIQLGRPVPNPVRGVVSYSVTLPRAMHVRIALFDLSGRQVRTLVDEERPAGAQQFRWDSARGGALLPGGVYTLGLDAGGVRLARRFVLIR